MTRQIQFENKNVRYQVSGKGDCLVLLHGFMEDSSMWERHMEQLSNNYQVLAIDLPGHGKTENFAEVHTMEFMAETVHAVIRAEQIEKCVMIGHSMGGYVSLAFSDKYSGLLSGLGLFHSHSLDDSEDAKRNRERTIEIIKAEKGKFINQFIPSLYAKENQNVFKTEIAHQIDLANHMNPAGITAALEGMKIRPMRLDVLAFSEVPVLFILGKQDSRIAIDQALAQAATPQLSQITILGNSGHMGWLEESSKTIAAIDGFMKLCKV